MKLKWLGQYYPIVTITFSNQNVSVMIFDGKDTPHLQMVILSHVEFRETAFFLEA